MRPFLTALLLFLAWAAAPALAQSEVVPDKRFLVTKDVDFYGSDLQALFDTTYEACEAACRGAAACRAFTFNTRSNSCFPKSQISDRQPYEGAWSAEVRDTDPAVLERAAQRSADLAYLGSGTLKGAGDLARRVGWFHPSGQYSLDQILQAAAERRAVNDHLNALRWTGGALAHEDRADLWIEYARLGLLVKTSNNTRTYRSRAVSAAINGYIRANGAGQQASALVQLAQALEANRRGRDMIPALRLAEQLQPRDDITAQLDAAIGKYGFRIVEHRVESDSAAPRLCARFSEPLAKSGVDYATYVRAPELTMAVSASGNDLCIDGAEHGKRYEVTFRAGLPDATGEALVKDVRLRLYVRDRTPSVIFPGRAYVLPKGADAALPVQTVNLNAVDLVLRRVSDRNLLRSIQDRYFGQRLSYWAQNDFATEVAEEVWRGSGVVENELNRDMTTRLPMGEIIADLPAGLYALSASVPGVDAYDDPGATQWFVLSDLGLTTLSGVDGLHVFVRGLGDAAPRAGVTATLLSRSNRVLGTAETDDQGHAVFAPGLTRGTGGAAPGLVMVQQGETDMGFLSLTDPGFDLSDRGVEGREASPPVDVFLTTDRGAYRAGEVIHVTALARDGVAAAISGLPLTAILTRPDGVEHSRILSADDRAGGHVFHLPLSASVPRGTWHLAIKADPEAVALASTSVLVEDFLPERIDFDLSLPEGLLVQNRLPELGVSARYLFGPPAGDLAVEGDVQLRAVSSLEAFPGYRFGQYDGGFTPRSRAMDGTRTDAQGRAGLTLDVPNAGDHFGPLEARMTVRVIEGSGRPVERQITRPLAPLRPMIGIRPMFDDVLGQGEQAAFRLIGVGPDMGPAALPVRWTLNRVERRYQWYQQYGNWNWEPVTSRQRIATGTATLGADPVEIAQQVDWGRYELVVESELGDYTAASVDFYAGWYVPADAASTPDMLEMSLDKPRYLSGETAQLRLVPRAAGQALITVMSNRVVAMKAVEVTAGENLIDLEVTDEWGAGAYVTAQVIRPMDVAAGRNPARALGLSYAAIDPGAKQLEVDVQITGPVAPRAPLEAAVRVQGAAPGQTAFVSVAAVDVGILNLTGFKSPDPAGHYFGQRRLGVEIRDVYGRLIDGLNGALGQVRSGGDAGSQMRQQSPPPTEDLVAYFSGPVAVGVDGLARVSFELPEFNGTVRLMAVAWSGTAVGQAETDVIVADPVVVTASVPRFMAPGDAARLLLEVVHVDGPAGRMGLDVSAQGLMLDAGAIPSGITLVEKGKQTLSVPLRAGDVGDHSLRIALTTPDGRQLVKSITLPVRSNDPAASETRQLVLDAGQTLVLDSDLFAGLRPGTASAVLSTGPLAKMDVPRLLAQLDRYPYGCTEQVTSKAMPLLYLSGVAGQLGLGDPDRITLRIDQAIERILTRQASGGGFGLWRAQSGDFWLDAYVTDFLSRARAAGHAVPDRAFRTALDNLRNRVNYAPDFDKGGTDIAYALLVLAREGAAAMGDLRYYADEKADAFSTPLAAAQLGAALASYGDQTRADAMFGVAARLLIPRMGDDAAPIWRADYGTNLRDAAGVLALAIEAGSRVVNTQALSERISSAGRDFSTQEAAWALMAARALVDDPAASGLSLEGRPVAGPLVHRFGDDLTAPQHLQNTGAGPVAITLTTLGVPRLPPEAGGYGYKIERLYYDMEGAPVDAQSVRAGDRLVVVLRVLPFQKTGARLMINDPLPAGFEIDNPNLLRAGDIRQLDWLSPTDTQHAEFRSDRFLAAVDWRSEKPFELAYIVRAITPGVYHHPAATVEDMYRPQYRARTGAGRVQITQ